MGKALAFQSLQISYPFGVYGVGLIFGLGERRKAVGVFFSELCSETCRFALAWLRIGYGIS